MLPEERDDGDIKQDRMFIVASVRVPEIIDWLEPLLPPLPPDTDQ